jgi:AcrR family transcriptional regulator
MRRHDDAATPVVRLPRAEVRHRLLDAAERVFAERGYAEARLADIARAAGFTKGAVYSNFGSKQELFAELITRQVSSNLARALAEVVARRSPQTVAEDTADVLAECIVTETALLRLVLEFAARAEHDEAIRAEYVAMFRRHHAQLADVLAEGAAHLGAEFTVPLEQVTLLLAGLRYGLGVLYAADPDHLSPQRVRDVIAAALRGLLRARELPE